MRFAAGLLSCVTLVPAVSHAQSAPAAVSATSCRAGRVASELTLWRCCWPGQVWNDERARCAGPPMCPSDTEAQGEECVASRGVAEVESIEARIARGVEEDRRRASHTARRPYDGGPVPAGYRLVHGGGALRSAGGVLLVLGVAPAVITGIYGLAAGNANAPLAYALIPVAGMPVSVFECGFSLCNMSPGGFLGYAIGGWVASAFQLTGAILALVGANIRPHLERNSHSDLTRWRVGPWVAGEAIGVVITM